MSGPLAIWHTEHIYFRRLLELLQKELDSFHRGERPNYELMLDIVPILLGRGERVWDGLEGLEERFAIESVSSPSGVTHVTFTRR